ncbi:MAG: GMP synthase (glutamine-hydrolyzing), partial [Candidatus Bathyarchaeota archaeon]
MKKLEPGPRAALFDAILVLDFGGQYCHLIARRIREEGVYSEIFPCDVTAKEVLKMGDKLNIKGIILSGGPSSVYDKGAPTLDTAILNLNIPVLGLCYGHQLIAHMFGGKVERGSEREYGSTTVTID